MTQESQKDWADWHDGYDAPGSIPARRLEAVHGRIRPFLDAAPAGPVRAASFRAGQGRDLIGVLAAHPRAADVTARLVEMDRRNVEVARAAARAAASLTAAGGAVQFTRHRRAPDLVPKIRGWFTEPDSRSSG